MDELTIGVDDSTSGVDDLITGLDDSTIGVDEVAGVEGVTKIDDFVDDGFPSEHVTDVLVTIDSLTNVS